MNSYFKQPRLRDRKYLDSFKNEVCISCLADDGTIVGAHIRTGHEGGTSLKPSDDLVLPLCARCHAEQEANPGPHWWLENIVKAIARRKYMHWKNHA